MRVILTGGAGYIGSHTALAVLAAGHEVLIVDDFRNSSPNVIHRLRELSNGALECENSDVRDTDRVCGIFEKFQPEAVIHFAGLKSVEEGEREPVSYYDVNVGGTLSILESMSRSDCGMIVFSSSATVYGNPRYLPLDEDHPCEPISVYGRSKLMAERAISDWQAASGGTTAVLLRYFNPVGAHESGRIGEDPRGTPANLMPMVAQVATGVREKLQIYGDDYDTIDGTGVRDYIHVTDLAAAHLAAFEFGSAKPGTWTYNLGTGRGYSVLEMVRAFEAASGKRVPFDIVARRPGDLASCYADPSRARLDFGWSAAKGLEEMCESLWLWQSENPSGLG